MKIAVISDIHGNLAALDAVLADISRRGADLTVNLGDILSGGLHPRETADRLMPLALPTIRGNHERQVLTLPRDRMGPSDRHAASTLRADQLDWLTSLPRTLQLSPEVLMVHGTPASDIEYFLETVTEAGVRPAAPAEIEARSGGLDPPVLLCGHTHLSRVVKRKGGGLIVNPGSVGLPAYADDRPFPHVVETGSPHARYAMVRKTGGAWSAELFAVEYDWETGARDAEANHRPDWRRALRTGRV